MNNGVTFQSVARAVCSRVGWDLSQLTTVQWELLRTEINENLRAAWQAWWWEDLMETRRVTLRETWTLALLCQEGTWYYHEDSDAYYCALTLNQGSAPASWDGSDWVVDYQVWARLDAVSGTDQGDWQFDWDYALGARVNWRGNEYQCIAAHTSSTIITPAHTVYWRQVVAFDYTLPYAQAGRPVIGRVRRVSEEDPRKVSDPTLIEFQPVADGIRLVNLKVTRPWLNYRVRCVELDGDAWDSATAYTAEPEGRAIWGL